jgi:hypothetical protein
MICILAMIVFAVLGIFSLSYRRLAYEAFDCVFRRVTLRPCESGLDVRLKSKIVGKLLKINRLFAGFVYHYFEFFSWALVILTFVSMYYVGLGAYNYAAYGNCNGPDGGFCPFDPLSEGAQFSTCGDAPRFFSPDPTVPELYSTDPYIGPADAKVTVVQFGCYSCQYTRQSQSVFNRLIENYQESVRFVYLDFPIGEHSGAIEAARAAECAKEQGKFWQYHDALFRESTIDSMILKGIAKNLNMNLDTFEKCQFDERIYQSVQADYDRGLKSGIKGTPTFFVNGQYYTGNIKYEKLQQMIDEELAK